MTREQAKQMVKKLTNDIERFGAYRVLKTENYLYWNDDKKKAKEKVKELYEEAQEELIGGISENWKELEEDSKALEMMKRQLLKKIDSAGPNDVIVVDDSIRFDETTVFIYDYTKLEDYGFNYEEIMEDSKKAKKDSVKKNYKIIHKRDGAGAGYHIIADNYRILSGTIGKCELSGKDNDYLEVECNLSATCDVYAESYDSGTVTFEETPIKITHISLSDNMGNDFYNYDFVNEDGYYNGNKDGVMAFIKDYIDSVKTKMLYGGGWSHVRWDGTISDSSSRVMGDYNYNVDGIDARTKDEYVIQTLDDMIANPENYDEYGDYIGEEEPYEDSKKLRKDSQTKDAFEALWYEGEDEDEAMNGDPHTKEFKTRKEVMNFYEKHKNDKNKFGWWVTRRDSDWFVVEDIVF